MSVLAQLISRIPGQDAYQQQVAANDAASMQQVQQAHGLMGILAQAQAQQKAQRDFQLQKQYRAEIGAAETPDQRLAVASKYMGPDALGKTLQSSQDRQAQIKATQEATLARMQQNAQQFDQNMQLRWSNAKDAREKANIEAQWKQGRLALDQAALQQAGKRLYYDTGQTVDIPATPQIAAPAAEPAPSTDPVTFKFKTPGGQMLEGTAPSENEAVSIGQAVAGMKPAAAPVAPPVAAPAPAAPSAAPAPVQSNAPATSEMPQFTGSPKEQAAARNKWLLERSKSSGAAALSPEALQIAGWEKLLFGVDPKGLGTASAQQRAQVYEARARIGKGLGLTEQEMAMLPQDNKVKMKAVGNLVNWEATVSRAAEKLDLDLKVAIDYAKKLPLSTVQMVNKGVIAGMKEFNDPDANAYATALNSVRLEYSRLMAGPTSNAMLPVEAMKRGNELLSAGVDVPSLEEIGRQMRRDAENTKIATRHQIDGLRGTMTGGKSPVEPDRRSEARPESKRVVVTY